VATVTSDPGATLGSFTFNISKLATASQLNGATGIAQTLVPTGETPAEVSLSTAAFATPVTTGTFTIDGDQITVGASDTLQDVFNNIASATNNAVTASYNATTDGISLTSSSPIVLGSETDTSNFLQSAGLYGSSSTHNATTGDYTSASNTALGTVQLNASMADSGLKTAITGGGNGAFTINGVTINYDANNDSISDVLNDINTSSAGVTASYDNLTNNFILTNNTTGAIGISAQDAPGSNFLAATGLAGGTLQQGDNLLYTVNDDPTQLVSQSNTITSASSGINGLNVTPLEPGSTTVSVSTNTGAITTAINQFISDYNTAQSYIASQQAVTTSSSGTTSPSTLTGDLTANNLASDLRTSANNPVSGLSGAITMLSDLGIQTNGQNNTIALSDSSTLSTALTNNLSDVQSFFSSTNGWGTQMTNWLNSTIGTGGTIPNQQATLTQESTNITTQISNLETKISSDSAMWTSEFEAMEVAESQTNQEMTYLSEQVTNGTL
jgi:flagellar hook-associated protein 2